MKVKYGDLVKIKSGFYEGLCGIAKRQTTNLPSPNIEVELKGVINYGLETFTIEFDTEQLEVIEKY